MKKTRTDEPKLSAAGKRRRLEIEDTLTASVRNRRRGRQLIAGASSALAIAAAAIVGYSMLRNGPSSSPPPTIVRLPASSESASAPTAPPPASVIVRVVTNEPLPDRPCSDPARGGAAGASICVLTDDQLLAALSQTGESYGIVRMGGKMRVVANSSH